MKTSVSSMSKLGSMPLMQDYDSNNAMGLLQVLIIQNNAIIYLFSKIAFACMKKVLRKTDCSTTTIRTGLNSMYCAAKTD